MDEPLRLTVIGAPSSAGAYAPGQEKAPAALRAAGLVNELRARGIDVEDMGDVPGFRWRPDPANARAMHRREVRRVAQDLAARVKQAVDAGRKVLVLGGDCTVELGTVAGVLASGSEPGLIYVDLDADLNTPQSTADGALDWMGVAHMLALPDTLDDLAGLAVRRPMLGANQLLYFGTGNVEPFERDVIDRLQLQECALREVASDPVGTAREAAAWGSRFERLLIHVDLDVLDFIDLPLAENSRRNIGLRFDQLMPALARLLQAPNWTALTICELNPDHGDGSTLRRFVAALVAAMA